MIVRRTDDAVHVITQPAHAALARRIMERWRPLADEPRAGSILRAIGEHDNGWREPDADPDLGEDRHIADFVGASREVRQGVWPRGVGRLEHDPWAAALVAHHAVTVYGRFRGDADWDDFFREMEATRDRMAGTARHTKADLAHDYTYVRLGDLISLTFCTGWEGEQRYDRWRVRLEAGGRVVVEPSELAVPELPIEIEAAALDADAFPSRAALREALSAAPRMKLSGVVT